MAVEGGTRFIKYLLFIFNLLFLLAGLALVIIGAVATHKLTPYSTIAGVHFNGVGVFLIIIGIIIFVISFFGCLGAYKENHCLLVTFIVLLAITLLALIAALIAAFVMRNQVDNLITKGLNGMILEYAPNDASNWATKQWDTIQTDLHCCGSNGTLSWKDNKQLNASSVPSSCCKNVTQTCGIGESSSTNVYQEGCSGKISSIIFDNAVAVGGAAAAIAILMFIGILFASCLAHGIRKHYQTV